MTPPSRAPTRAPTLVALLLYALGVLWLGAMAFVAAWPDMEASVFDPSTALMAQAGLPELRCPWVMTAGETATVRVRFTNRAEKAEAFLVRARISRGYASFTRGDTQPVRLLPGEERELSWPVTAADAAFGRIVLVRVLATRGLVAPARQSPCGILVLKVPGGGQSLFAAGILLGLALMGAGALGWWFRRRPLGAAERSAARAASPFAGLVLASLVAGLAGAWLLSHLLLVGVILYFFVWLEARA